MANETFAPALLRSHSLSTQHQQVLLLSLTFAFVIVVISTFLSVPVLLYGLNLQREGWNWVHVALFSSMIASTDAVAGVWCSASHHRWGNHCRHGASTAVPS